MPYDTTALEALKVLSADIDAYQSRVCEVADRIDTYLAANDDESGTGHEAQRLGEFAAGRIDMERFTELWDSREVMDQLERAVLTRAHDSLRDIAARPKEQFIINLPRGGRLTAALTNIFADLGHAVGAMTIAELVRTRRFRSDDVELIHGLPRLRWTRADRATSPPVIVTLDGAGLWAGEIVQYLDGNQKIVLVVRSPAPPAPLVRLVTPGTLVIQTCSLEGLSPMLTAEGPAVAALMPNGAAEFVHTPGSAPMHERIVISTRPQVARRNVESWTAWQQQQELAQLYALAAAPASAASLTGTDAKPVSDPADRLASWLLAHS